MDEEKVYKVRHPKFTNDYFEHTYSESRIRVIGGVAHCHTPLAAKTLVGSRGYQWVDARDDEDTKIGKLTIHKRKAVAERFAEALKSAGKGMKNVAKSLTGRGKSKGKDSKKTGEEKEAPKASDSE